MDELSKVLVKMDRLSIMKEKKRLRCEAPVNKSSKKFKMGAVSELVTEVESLAVDPWCCSKSYCLDKLFEEIEAIKVNCESVVGHEAIRISSLGDAAGSAQIVCSSPVSKVENVNEI